MEKKQTKKKESPMLKKIVRMIQKLESEFSEAVLISAYKLKGKPTQAYTHAQVLGIKASYDFEKATGMKHDIERMYGFILVEYKNLYKRLKKEERERKRILKA